MTDLRAVCPNCGPTDFRIEWRLVAKQTAPYSLSGVQDKVAAVETPFAVCPSCGLTKQGKR